MTTSDSNLVDVIRSAWEWTGLVPQSVLSTNSFGNVIVRAVDRAIWRICPEELSCDRIADSAEQFGELAKQKDFRLDWEMKELERVALIALGPLSEGQSYCLKIPAILEGEYAANNFGRITLTELIACASDLAFQIKDLPEGARVSLRVI